MIQRLYPLLIVVILLLAILSLPFSRKMRKGFLPRVLAGRTLRAAFVRRDSTHPLVWFHAASAGELLQAEPIMARLREQNIQLMVSLSSISAVGWLDRFMDWPEVIWSGLLPPDFPWSVRGWLRGMQPTAVVHMQVDLWPGFVTTTHDVGIPQILMAARVGRRGNYRARFPMGNIYRALFGRMSLILCATESDREGLLMVVPEQERLKVGGDPGVETVLNRVREGEISPKLKTWAAAHPVLVLGSIWPTDEDIVLSGLVRVATEFPELRIIAAPHDPDGSHLQKLSQQLTNLGTIRLSELESSDNLSSDDSLTRVVLVDGVGRLASLYKLGAMAYVGGGFGSGVHNVAEPAAIEQAVLFGPRHGNSAVAKLLLEAKGACLVNDRTMFENILRDWMKNPKSRRSAGVAAKGVVEQLADGAEISYQALLDTVPGLAASYNKEEA